MSKRKLAFLFMGEYTPEKHQAVFEKDSMDTCIFTVRNFEEALALARRLPLEGYGVLEVCGAFGPDKAKALREAAGGKLAVGYVTHFPEDDALFDAFFLGK